jgi:RHS repeat-associated protein
LKSLAVSYGRRQPDSALSQVDQDKQTRILLTYTEISFTNAIDEPSNELDNYRTPLPSETRTYELTGFKPATDAKRFSVEECSAKDFALLKEAAEIRYEEAADPTKEQKRLIEHVRTLYRENDLSALLPLGVLEFLALPGESYELAFTADLVTKVYGDRVTDAMLATDGGYVHTEGDTNWWIPSGGMFYSQQISNTPAQELAFAQQHFYLPHRARDPFANIGFISFDPYDLLVKQTIDPVGNTTTAEQDYRVLQPFRVTDPNGNRMEVVFDKLGLVAGTAVMGKTTETKGDSLKEFVPDLTPEQCRDFVADPLGKAATLLGQATTRTVYDLNQYFTNQQPVFAATLARETHVSDPLPPAGLKIQVNFSYSDGFGRQIQKKIQAEHGPVISPRWVGSGWTIFNNKGKPVRQYEPFFSQLSPEKRHLFEFGVQVGVSPTLFYDPLERVVATLHPNHTWGKVIFDSWRQDTWDVNDTVLIADPKADANVGPFFQLLPDPDYLPSWYALRSDPAFAAQAAELWPDPKIRTAEKDAATKAAVHANTPTVAFSDTLGRPVLTIAQNRFERNGAIIEEQYATRMELDIEGNQRAVRDAIVQNGDQQGRVVMRYDYDMLGNHIHQASMEAGERWMLNDVGGRPLYAWDSRGFLRHVTYDALRRPMGTFVTENGVERLDASMAYGEGQGAADNHRTRVFQVFDGAGVVTSEAYDFKGNLLRSRRELLPNYQQAVDWQQNPDPNDGTFTSSTTYDALNRPTTTTAPDNSIYRPTYNEANLLDRVEVNLRGAAATTPFVTNIDYDAKGQRELITYGNGAQTHYEYNPLTFRLTKLRTTRPTGLNGLASQLFTDPGVVQDLHYTYDPAGNITRIEDAALRTIVHNNEPVQPVSRYTYDAIYRLIEAEGREHIGQTAHDFNPPDGNRRDFDFAGLADFIAHPNDMQAMRNYTEGYEYDAVGNFQFMRHSSNGGSWTRRYEYDAASLIEPAKKSNRITRTRVGNGTNFIETYTYGDAQGNDVHGCMTAINNMKMVWDSKDQLQQVDLGGGGTAYYVYDGGGQRIRRVIEQQSGSRQKERIYLGGLEIYREYNGSGTTVMFERETLHIMDDKQRIALVETKTKDTSSSATLNPQPLIRYQLGNHLGSASLELDDRAQIISYEEYYPYGSTSYQAGRNAAEVTLKRYRYTGMERDEESGLNYHIARYYAPWLGRWISCDPIGTQDGLNLYQYCGVNPINKIDRMGSDEWSWNPLNIFNDDYTFNPGEYTGKVARGVGKAIKNTVVDTATRVVDLATQSNAAYYKARYGIELPYTEWSPESKRYDENLSIRENIQKTGVETKEGLKAFGKLLSEKDPDAVGTLVFTVATSVGGKPPSFPNIPFLPIPQLATSVATTGVRVTELVWQGTAISTSTLAKVGGPILAVAATSQSIETRII